MMVIMIMITIMMVDNLYIIDIIIIHDDREQEIYIVSVSSSSS